MRWLLPKRRRLSRRQRLVLPDKDFSAIYAIGDIHGCAREYKEAESRILADARFHPGTKLIILLGDYVDRGPDSRTVLEALEAPPARGFTRIALCGNHDDEFAKMVRNPREIGSWLQFAGSMTLLSYGIDAQHIVEMNGLKALHDIVTELVPERHVALLEALPVCVKVGGIVFVHAGVRPSIALEEQTDRDLMWIREPFLGRGPELPFIVVHGHSPFITPSLGTSRIGIDTGASSTGVLTVLKISDGRYSFI